MLLWVQQQNMNEENIRTWKSQKPITRKTFTCQVTRKPGRINAARIGFSKDEKIFFMKR